MKQTGRHSKNTFLRLDTEINQALLFLREINTEEWHDRSPNTGDKYDLIRFIDKHIHPTYLRLIEAVLVPLTLALSLISLDSIEIRVQTDLTSGL